MGCGLRGQSTMGKGHHGLHVKHPLCFKLVSVALMEGK